MRPGCPNFRRIRGGEREGFILVTVLMVSTLLLGSAASFAWFAKQEMRRVSSEEFALISRSLAHVALYTASEWIADDSNDYDSELEIIYAPQIPLILPFDDWDVTVNIIPQDRLIPINAIFLPDGVTMRRELEHPWKEIWGLMDNDELSSAILDFLDGDTEARPGSKEEEFYANEKIDDLSELLRLPNLLPSLLYSDSKVGRPTLDRFFTVYGEDKINVNLAPREILAILDPDIGVDVADSIITYRKEAFIASDKDLIKIPGFPISSTTRLNEIVGYTSNYFLVELKVENAERERVFNIMLRKSGKSCQIVHWRE